MKRSLLLGGHGALELHFCVTIIALAGSPCTGYGRLKVWIMWQVSHSQCGREMLAFFSDWFGWMLHSWVPNNVQSQFRIPILVLAGSPNIPEKKWFPAAPER